MAQVKLLKIASDGVPIEFSPSDDITLNSYTVQGGGPALSATGLAMANQDVSALKNLVFTDPTTDTLNQTAGSLVIDNIMAKDRSNTMTTASDILFPVITDTASQVDIFRLPTLAGPPTATPTKTGEGFIVWDSTNDDPYVWTGSAWDNLNIVKSSSAVDDTYIAEVTVAARDVVYISSADNVSPASASTVSTAQAIGVAIAGAAATAAVIVRKNGIMAGFTGLTAGSRYYLDGTTPGAITATVPTTSGYTIVSCGYAKNTTSLDLQLQTLGRRA